MVEIKENKMHLTVKIVEYTSWLDPRLDYRTNPQVPEYFKNSRIDITAVRNMIWRPEITYSELNRYSIISEHMFLYPNGTITYFKAIILGITCDFNYKNMPTD